MSRSQRARPHSPALSESRVSAANVFRLPPSEGFSFSSRRRRILPVGLGRSHPRVPPATCPGRTPRGHVERPSVSLLCHTHHRPPCPVVYTGFSLSVVLLLRAKLRSSFPHPAPSGPSRNASSRQSSVWSVASPGDRGGDHEGRARVSPGPRRNFARAGPCC